MQSLSIDNSKILGCFRDIDAGLAMGAMCIIIGIIYMIDFFVSYFARRRLLSEERA